MKVSTATELLQKGKTEDIWQKYCGFIDFSIEEFMEIQRHLLLEQLGLLANCELGQRMMGDARPTTVEEFRLKVPLTSYEDYAPYLLKKRGDVLPEKPLLWQRTAGRYPEYRFKWVPVTERLFRETGAYLVSWAVFCSCRERGDINFKDHDKVLYGMAPPPYTTGALARVVPEEFKLDFLPPMEKAERMPSRRRMDLGVSLALAEGLDFVFALSGVLVGLGQRISDAARVLDLSYVASSPGAWPRVAKALLKSRLARRPLLPRDLWTLKGLACTGGDTAVYRDRIKYYWGREPLEVYGAAEVGIFALQAWNYKDMTFVPTTAFLEFIPEEEHLRLKADPAYRPRTLLLDEVEAGQRYELVLTSLQGGPFVRYRIGDMIRVNSLRDEELGIDLPQIAVDNRVDGLIGIGGYARLGEKAIERAIEDTELACEGWTARKEVIGGEPVVHVYIELRDGELTAEEARLAIHRSLKRLNHDYAAMEDVLGFQPATRVTLLPQGAFERYRAQGGDSPPRIDASDEVISRLLGLDKEGGFGGPQR